MEEKTTLLICQFETGDSSCRFWEEFRLIPNTVTGKTLEKLENHLRSDMFSDDDYDDMLDEALNDLGISFEFARFPLNNIKKISIIQS